MDPYDLLPQAQKDFVDLAAYASEYNDAARDLLTDTLFDCFELPTTDATGPPLIARILRQERDISPEMFSGEAET